MKKVILMLTLLSLFSANLFANEPSKPPPPKKAELPVKVRILHGSNYGGTVEISHPKSGFSGTVSRYGGKVTGGSLKYTVRF